MIHIKKIKTLQGMKYAVVELFTSTTKDLFNNDVTKSEFLPVDYKVGKVSYPAIFALNEEGLSEAKKIQKLFKNQ